MKKITENFKSIIKDESAQGATEYILLLVVVVGVVFMFKEKILAILKSKVDFIGDKMGEI